MKMNEKRTGLFENGLIWFGAGVSIAEILTGTYLAPLGMGKGLAAITPVIFKDLIPDAPERLAVISRMFGGTDENDCYKAILNLLKAMDMDVTLADLGFEDSDIEWLTNNCFEVSSWVMDGTPGTWDRERVERMYRASMTFNKEQA